MIGALLAVALAAPSGFVALDEVDPTILQEFGLTRCTAPYRRRFPTTP